MTDDITTTLASEDASVDFDADFFDEWIEGASPSRRSVTIYGKPGLYAEYTRIRAELEVAQAAAKVGELGGSGVAALQAREDELYDEWMASKTVWTVERLDPEASDRIREALAADGFVDPPEPDVPEMPEEPVKPTLPDDPTEKQQRTHTARMKAYDAELATYEAKLPAYHAEFDRYEASYVEWEKEHDRYVDESNYRMVVEGFVSIQDADGDTRATSITVPQLRRLAEKLGSAQILKLATAVNDATIKERELQAPFSRSTSEDDPT